MAIALREMDIPDFGIPEAMPMIPGDTCARRCDQAYAKAGRDWLAPRQMLAVH